MTNSREKFEAFVKKERGILCNDYVQRAMEIAWLAGRESMRDEAESMCYHHSAIQGSRAVAEGNGYAREREREAVNCAASIRSIQP